MLLSLLGLQCCCRPDTFMRQYRSVLVETWTELNEQFDKQFSVTTYRTLIRRWPLYGSIAIPRAAAIFSWDVACWETLMR